MTWLKLVEGYMPMQMITELAICILFFAAINFSLKKAGVGIPKFWAGGGGLDLYPNVLEVSDLSANPVQRASHLWDGFRLRYLYVGVRIPTRMGRF